MLSGTNYSANEKGFKLFKTKTLLIEGLNVDFKKKLLMLVTISCHYQNFHWHFYIIVEKVPKRFSCEKFLGIFNPVDECQCNVLYGTIILVPVSFQAKSFRKMRHVVDSQNSTCCECQLMHISWCFSNTFMNQTYNTFKNIKKLPIRYFFFTNVSLGCRKQTHKSFRKEL